MCKKCIQGFVVFISFFCSIGYPLQSVTTLNFYKMEAVEELAHQSGVEVLKASVGNDEEPVAALEASLCHTSNGVADPAVNPLLNADAVYYVSTSEVTVPHELQSNNEPTPTTQIMSDTTITQSSIMPVPAALQQELLVMETTAAVEHLLGDEKSSEVMTSMEQVVENVEGVPSNKNELQLEGSGVEGDIDGSNEMVTFKTEIVVEKNDNDVAHDSNNVAVHEIDHANNILNEFSQGIELSEALRSSDTIENSENNNCAEREEMFNKEELLDILEGNDVSTSGNEDVDMDKKSLEAQIAIRQLSRLKNKPGKRGKERYLYAPRKSRVSKKRESGKNVESASENDKEEENRDIQICKVNDKDSEASQADENDVSVQLKDNESLNKDIESKNNESIVNSLVKDWDDDDPAVTDPVSEVLMETDSLLKAGELINTQEVVTNEETVTTTVVDNSKTQSVDANKSSDETQPRRLGRVIKKKIIFDPDNPDTFTKGKVVSKTKDAHIEKEPPLKKVKSEPTPLRSKSKSPVAKSPWKKPNPKNNSKQNKRLTEVDKLLMDEGAVNMIYQLTPEAPKGKKNMKTKAEFIKKLQSSTPEGKEMKFRERKKELKLEEYEAKRILGGKQRMSLSSSVKSPSVPEDFETHSADDSIIYRRHSSSSYSSSCMSPRRLSDGDAGITQNTARLSQQHSEGGSDNQNRTQDGSGDQNTDIFMSDTSAEIINKDDCLSIKEKLNSKLSQVLNKRKRENNKTEKLAKQKKVSKTQEKSDNLIVQKVDVIKHISITVDQKVAEICIRGSRSSVEVKLI